MKIVRDINVIRQDKDGSYVITFYEGENLVNYSLKFTDICAVPTCECGVLNATVSREDKGEKETFDIGFSVLGESVFAEMEVPDWEKQASDIEDKLNESDWHFLRKKYLEDKRTLIESIENPKSIRHKFDKRELEITRNQYPFSDIFPHSIFVVELEGIIYNIFDSYCKNPLCACTNITLVVLIEKGDIKEMGIITYDYKTQELEIVENKIGDDTKLKNIIQILFEEEKDIDASFQKRNHMVREIFEAEQNRVNLIKVVNRKPKITRNAPCPCGSGKKYKKCCMK